MKILIVDGGGRGHSLGWKLKKSQRNPELFFAPGNGGTQSLGTNLPIGVKEIEKLLQFARSSKIDLTIASSDDSLALGIVDAFKASGLEIFGPTLRAAEIETSKWFAKELMARIGVPTAPFKIFADYNGALGYICEHGLPIVVKADGLALGKGAYVCKTFEEAETAITEIMVRRVHGDAGDVVVIEDFLEGPEVSIHALCDGENFVLFPSAQDHKPVFDGDRGPNTGGMGTISPVPWFTGEMMHEVAEKIVSPVLGELARLGIPFVGCLYPGLKLTPQGLKVLEFNARPGDPETQVYMRLLKTDLVAIMEACVNGTLKRLNVLWYSGSAACIVLASGGYPGRYKKGLPITGISDAGQIFSVEVFHAGTTKEDDGLLKTSGGRVMGITARGDTLQKALDIAYLASSRITFAGRQYRTDIGKKSLEMARGQ